LNTDASSIHLLSQPLYLLYYTKNTHLIMPWLVSQHHRGKPIWVLMKQEMIGWQWHQLDLMQITRTSLQSDNHANTSSFNFLQAGWSL